MFRCTIVQKTVKAMQAYGIVKRQIKIFARRQLVMRHPAAIDFIKASIREANEK